jgi:hypothetical protein
MGRRGPKKKTDVMREPNGRASRKPSDVTKQLNGDLEADEREALRVGVEARHRLFKLNPAHLRDTDAGTFVGRQRLAGELTMQQGEAAIRYSEVYHEMQMTLGGPKSAGALNPNATHGMPGAENVDRTIKAMEAWRAAQDAVQRRQNQLRGHGALYAALDFCVIRDAECPHLIEWLRIALDTLAVHFQIGDRRAKAA